MAFVVINSVRTSAAELPGVLAEVHALGMEMLREQPGFKSARLITAEDRTEAALILEWESRDHFVAYRQTARGQQMIQRAADALHPHISFYDVVVSLDPAAS
jgi:heme-degrading monooxygenase HmoA